MLDWLNELAQSRETPLLAAFALGLLTAISPCPLATNVTATAFIAKGFTDKKKVLLSGVLYTLGRAFSYTMIGLAIYSGASKFHLARFLQGNGEKFLAPILILIGLVMLGVIKLDFLGKGNFTDRLSEKFKNQGLFGAFMLGLIFALAFWNAPAHDHCQQRRLVFAHRICGRHRIASFAFHVSHCLQHQKNRPNLQFYSESRKNYALCGRQLVHPDRRVLRNDLSEMAVNYEQTKTHG